MAKNLMRVSLWVSLIWILSNGVISNSYAQQLSENTDSERIIEDIQVVARRREEYKQQTPISMNVIGKTEMELRNIENTKGLQLLLPNVDIRGDSELGGAAGSFAIRGVRNVISYIDGVPVNAGQGSLLNIVDLERIEVLRGPQGTYFGKGAMGGVIHYITKKPASQFEASGKVVIGSFDRSDFIAKVDMPLGESLRGKLVVGDMYRGGYVDSTNLDYSFGEQNSRILRGAIEWSASDNLDVLLTATSTREESGMQAYVLFDIIEGFNSGLGTPAAYNNPAISSEPFTDDLYSFGKSRKYLSASDYRGTGVDFHSSDITMAINWDITADIWLRSITNVRDLHSGVWQDSDSTPLGYSNLWAYDEVEALSQEIHLAGSTYQWDWILGFFVQTDDKLEVDSSWRRIELTGTGSEAPRINNTLGRTVVADRAIYGETVYHATDRFSLTLGMRYSNESLKSTTFSPLNPISAEDMNTPNYSTEGVVVYVDGVPLIKEVDFDAVTGRMAAQYQVSEDIMIYSGLSEGFNAGGVNTRFDPSLPDNGIIPFGGEKLRNYEIGIRSVFFDNTLQLNATAFIGKWRDFQIIETLGLGQEIITNGGLIKNSGMEIDGIWKITRDITADFTIGILETDYVDVGLLASVDLNTTIPFSPERSFSAGIQWNKKLSDGASVTSRMDWGWISDFETYSERIFQTENGVNDAYGLLGAHVAYQPAGKLYSIDFFGTNLTNQWYRLGGYSDVLSGIDQGVVARPREIGVAVRLEF